MNNRLLSFVRCARSIVQKRVDRYSCKYSKQVYEQPQRVVLNVLRIREDWTYQQTIEHLEVMDTIQEELDIERIPDPSTLYYAYNRINGWAFRWMLTESSSQIESSGTMAVDATGFNRHWASRYNTKRTEMKLSALKVTIRADVGDTMAIRDVHITTTRKHDTQILPKVIPKDEPGSCLAADRGYDHQDRREWCRYRGIRPLIKHRTKRYIGPAANARMDTDDYNQRQKVESIFSSIKRKYGDDVTSRVWHRQFRDVIAKMIVFNIDQLSKNDLRILELFRQRKVA